MKKAKIMLSVTLILTVIIGVFSFKAYRVPSPFCSNTTIISNGLQTVVCMLPVAIFYTTTQNNLGTVGALPYSTVCNPTGPCTTTLYRTL
jgi:hypothetical protein